jgi:NitT/TauT family transport system ATP-binding protein
MFAFAFQNPVLLPWRTVRQNVSLPLEIMQRGDSKDTRLADEMLAMVGLCDFDKAMPSELSGGMQQRANLARALVQEPRVLLMDEPFGSLDEVTRERLNFELLRIHQLRKPTILFVTHSLSEAILLADRVIVLSRRPATIRVAIPVSFQQERTESILLSTEYLVLHYS